MLLFLVNDPHKSQFLILGLVLLCGFMFLFAILFMYASRQVNVEYIYFYFFLFSSSKSPLWEHAHGTHPIIHVSVTHYGV